MTGICRAAALAGRGAKPIRCYVAHELREPITLRRALAEMTLADPDAEVAARRATGERVIAACERGSG
jgi:hypothetical protein